MLRRGGHSGEIIGLIVKGIHRLTELFGATSNAQKLGANVPLAALIRAAGTRIRGHIFGSTVPHLGSGCPQDAKKPPAAAGGFVVLPTERSVVAAKAVVDANPDDVIVECNVVARGKARDRRRCEIGLLARSEERRVGKEWRSEWVRE